jgi:hypothetical protein
MCYIFALGAEMPHDLHLIRKARMMFKSMESNTLESSGIALEKHTPMMQQRVLSMKTALRFSKVTPKVTPLE